MSSNVPNTNIKLIKRTPTIKLPVDPWITFAKTTVGRDKFYRTVQYFAKLVVWYLNQTSNVSKHNLERWSKLAAAVGLARKLFRVGKPLDFAQNIVQSFNIRDDVERVATIGKSFFQGSWLVFDFMQWTHGSGVYVLSKDSIGRMNTYAARCWFYALIFGVIGSLYKLRVNSQKYAIYKRKLTAFKGAEGSVKSPVDNDYDDIKKSLGSTERERESFIFDLISDVLDLTIPGTSLDIVQLGQGVPALAGTITSMLGMYRNWPK